MLKSLGVCHLLSNGLSLFLSFIFCPTSFRRQWAAFLGTWCLLLAVRSCFVKFAQRSNVLSMNMYGRKWSPRPIPLPSWLLLSNGLEFLKYTHVCVLNYDQLFATLLTIACRLLSPWDSPGKNTGVVCNTFLQVIFLTQESNLHPLRRMHRRWILYLLSHQGSPKHKHTKWKSDSVSCSVVSDYFWPMNCRLPGSSIHGIFQARILEWAAIPFFRGSS